MTTCYYYESFETYERVKRLLLWHRHTADPGTGNVRRFPELGAIDTQRFCDLLLFVVNCFMLMGGDACLCYTWIPRASGPRAVIRTGFVGRFWNRKKTDKRKHNTQYSTGRYGHTNRVYILCFHHFSTYAHRSLSTKPHGNTATDHHRGRCMKHKE